ncbi:olfactory receptor 5F1-like [Tiliqua scincoides]|uniref:olfactory receptor 5F1-like n=1 Tax=Tiliqua scincoides TaxID=71010 RepID=UPI003461A965
MDSTNPIGRQNQTSFTGFVLMGFSVDPKNKSLLFVAGLITYLLTLAGNLIIIILICVDQCLKTPMYILLGNLSFIEICYMSTILPKVLWDLLLGDKTITFIGCALQMYFFITLASTECVLLSVMAYDRYAAVCHPLHYTTLMRQSICTGLLAISWCSGHFNSIVNTASVFSLTFCHSNAIDHFFCDIPPIQRLSCSDIFASQLVTFTVSGCILVVTSSMILLSYILIASSVLKLHTAHGRMNAFSTCVSHLTVVSIFYGTIIYTYLQPSSSHSLEQDCLVSVWYTVLIPLLNPLIYRFRNKEVQGALWRTLGKDRS